MNCNCPLSGVCERFGWSAITQPARFDLCAGKTGRPELEEKYRQLWDERLNGKPRPEPAVRHIDQDYPCIHRGRVTLETVDCGCTQPAAVYDCNCPDAEFSTCIRVKKKAGKLAHGICSVCTLRSPSPDDDTTETLES